MNRLVLVLAVACAACGRSGGGPPVVNYDLKTQVDRATGARVTSQRIVANSHADCGYPGLWLGSVTLVHSTVKDGGSVFEVEATYVGPQRIFIQNQPAQLIADATPVSLAPERAPSELAGKGWVAEGGSYKLPADQLTVLRNARAVKARLQGRSGVCTWQFAPPELVRLRSFASHELQ